MMHYIISSYCRINDCEVVLDGKVVASLNPADLTPWMLQVYKQLNIQYAKFHKMDTMSKAGFIAAELLTGKDDEEIKEDWGIHLFTNSSSIETDTAFQATILEDNYYPAPSLFVYTLPNIVTGEIAIRHKIYGETSCCISKDFSSEMLIVDVENILKEGTLTTILCGWINQEEGHTDVFMLRVDKTHKSGLELTNDNLIRIWKH